MYIHVEVVVDFSDTFDIYIYNIVWVTVAYQIYLHIPATYYTWYLSVIQNVFNIYV